MGHAQLLAPEWRKTQLARRLALTKARSEFGEHATFGY